VHPQVNLLVVVFFIAKIHGRLVGNLVFLMKGYAEKSMILLQHVNKIGIKIWYSICSQRVEFQLGDQISTEINNSDIEVKS
jgi:hypothetical protein